MASLRVFGSRIEVFEQGSGEPVLLLHSSAGSSAQWRALAERLSSRFRVIAPDLYGYGGSAAWPGRGAFSLAHEACIVHALLSRLNEPAHLVGHSYGGAVALHVARQRDDLLRSLTLVEPVAFHLLEERAEIAALAATVARALASGDYLGGFGTFVDYWNGAGSWEALPLEKREAAAARLGKVALDFHAALNEPARIEDLCAITLPTLLVLGERSPRPARRVCALLARVLPAARLATVAGAGHMSPLTHREQVNGLIASHLEECSDEKHQGHGHRRGASAGWLRELTRP